MTERHRWEEWKKEKFKRGGRKPGETRERDVAFARKVNAKKLGSRRKLFRLAVELGRKEDPPLGRTAAWDAYKRGNKILSGE